MLNCIVYVSCVSALYQREALADILHQSRQNNAARGITGLLLYVGGNFMQAIEGPEKETQTLIEQIREDPRHHDMRVIVEFPINKRSFPDWSMAFREGKELAPETREGVSSFLSDALQRDAEERGEQASLALRLLHGFAETMW